MSVCATKSPAMVPARGPAAVVIPLVPRRVRSVLTVCERIELLRWTDAARAFGIRAARIHEPEQGDDPALGGFILFYTVDGVWAAWGVAPQAGRYEVWRPNTGITVGWFACFADALAAIQPVG
jgi:hypothetical protein